MQDNIIFRICNFFLNDYNMLNLVLGVENILKIIEFTKKS